jgi:hypothetical protein
MIAFIDDHRGAYGVEPICEVLPIAPSTYRIHAARRADPSRLPARKTATTLCSNGQPWQRDSNQIASDKPGAV